MTRRFFSGMAAAVLPLWLGSCGDADRTAKASIVVEKGGDGLFHASGRNEPYTGEVIRYGSGGRRAAEEHYQNGKPDGVWRTWWGNDTLKSELTHRDGAPVFRRLWHENGSRREETALQGDSPVGLWMIWHPNGRIKRQMFLEPGSKKHGQVLEYAEDGTLLWDALYEHGKYLSGKEPPPAAK